MPNEELPVPLFRAYLSRKPGGLLLVTVLSTLLPRPLFRSYPLDIGEAAAVERSVGHAMCALKKCAPSKGQQGNNPCFKAAFPRCNEQHEGYPDNVCEHSHALLPTVNVVAAEPLTGAFPASPHGNDGINCNGAEQAEEHASDVKHGLRHGSPHGLHQPCELAAVRSEEQDGAEGYAVKQHLRLRVVWQKLLLFAEEQPSCAVGCDIQTATA